MNKIICSDDPAWNEYIQRLPRDKQDIYFTPEYHKLYEINGDGTAALFVFEKSGDFAVYPFMLNQVTGYETDRQYYDIQSAYGYGGPVSSTDDREFLSQFENSFVEYALRNNIIAEFIRFHPLINNESIFLNNIEILQDRKTVWMDSTPDLDKIFEESIHPRCRRDIRAGERKGLIAKTGKMTDTFKDIYVNTMKSLNADSYYFFSDGYFKQLAKSQSSTVIDICLDDKVIASGIFLTYGDYFHYHLGGSDRAYSSYTPTTLMLWEAVKLAKSNGCQYIHFGGGRSIAEDDSLLKFKSQFSSDRAEFYIGKRVHNEEVYACLIEQWEQRNNTKAKRLLDYRIN